MSVDDLLDEILSINSEYRVILFDGVLSIGEIYYDDEGDILEWTMFDGAMGNDLTSLGIDLENMMEALNKPILKQVGEDEFAKLIEWEG